MASDRREKIPSCPECGSNGVEPIEEPIRDYDFRCTDCGYEFSGGGNEALLA